MDDLIRRTETINAIKELVATMSVCTSVDELNGMNIMRNRIIKKIMEMPTFGWISCKDRLPDKDGYYLITSRFEMMHISYFCDGQFEHSMPLAWIPLPEIYKE